MQTNTYFQIRSIQVKQLDVIIHPYDRHPYRVNTVRITIIGEAVERPTYLKIKHSSPKRTPAKLTSRGGNRGRCVQCASKESSPVYHHTATPGRTFPDSLHPTRPSARRSCQCPRSNRALSQTTHPPSSDCTWDRSPDPSPHIRASAAPARASSHHANRSGRPR